MEYDFIPIAEERILIAAPQEMIMRSENGNDDYPIVSLSEVMKYPFISLSEKQYFGKVVKQLYDIAECIPNIVMECRSADMAIQMVGVGLGVAVIPEFSICNENKRKIQYYTLKHPDIRRVVGISYKKGAYVTEDVKLLVTLLKEHFIVHL